MSGVPRYEVECDMSLERTRNIPSPREEYWIMRAKLSPSLSFELRTGSQNSNTVTEIITPPARDNAKAICDGETALPGKAKMKAAPMTVDSPAMNEMPILHDSLAMSIALDGVEAGSL
jgi:hypothetical protein